MSQLAALESQKLHDFHLSTSPVAISSARLMPPPAPPGLRVGLAAVPRAAGAEHGAASGLEGSAGADGPARHHCHDTTKFQLTAS